MTELSSDFRDAMRRLAATVNVITACHDGVAMGMTATAVSSLSMEPPSLLVCVNQSASMHNSLVSVTRFCVNVLHRDQEAVARAFSDRTMRDVRFEQGGWVRDDSTPPYLPNAQAVLECEREQVIAFATHSICIGVVKRVLLRDDIDPLVYLDGSFGSALAR